MGQIPKFWKQKNPAKIRNVDKEFAKELDFKALKFPIQKEKKKKKKYAKTEKQNNISLNPIQDGSFWGCSAMGVGEAKRLPSVKSVRHILQ